MLVVRPGSTLDDDRAGVAAALALLLFCLSLSVGLLSVRLAGMME
jgi:ABC-type sugar transport system permease subunit